MTRRPTAFNLDEVRFEPEELYPEADAAEQAALDGAVVPVEPRRRGRVWLGVFLAAVAVLILLAVGVGVDNLIRSLFDRSDILGWLARWSRRLPSSPCSWSSAARLPDCSGCGASMSSHAGALAAATADDREQALLVVREMDALYRRRPETARGRAYIAGHRHEIIDGRNLIGLAETNLLLPFDGRGAAHGAVVGEAGRAGDGDLAGARWSTCSSSARRSCGSSGAWRRSMADVRAPSVSFGWRAPPSGIWR